MWLIIPLRKWLGMRSVSCLATWNPERSSSHQSTDNRPAGLKSNHIKNTELCLLYYKWDSCNLRDMLMCFFLMSISFHWLVYGVITLLPSVEQLILSSLLSFRRVTSTHHISFYCWSFMHRCGKSSLLLAFEAPRWMTRAQRSKSKRLWVQGLDEPHGFSQGCSPIAQVNHSPAQRLACTQQPGHRR